MAILVFQVVGKDQPQSLYLYPVLRLRGSKARKLCKVRIAYRIRIVNRARDETVGRQRFKRC